MVPTGVWRRDPPYSPRLVAEFVSHRLVPSDDSCGARLHDGFQVGMQGEVARGFMPVGRLKRVVMTKVTA